MITALKKIASRLPPSFQQELKRMYFWFQIRFGHFKSEEADYNILDKYILPGDWVIDVGANIGHYTMRFSKLVGPDGRVIAFEPVPETFDLLTSNSMRFPHKNVTLINAAVSNCSACSSIKIPKFQTGLSNYYAAHLSNQDSNMRILCLTMDSLDIPYPVSLIKVDVEGHEFEVIEGMKNLLKRDKPVLIIEGFRSEVDKLLGELGYSDKKLPGSPNKIFDICERLF